MALDLVLVPLWFDLKNMIYERGGHIRRSLEMGVVVVVTCLMSDRH